ncbi:MAG: aldo/keto reductase [Ferruginibacter sp.]
MLENIAYDTGAKVIDVALAWIRQKYDHSTLSTVTIIGPRTLQQLEDNLSSLELQLTQEQINQLNDISKFDLGSPHEVIAASQNNIVGKESGKIEIKHSVR